MLEGRNLYLPGVSRHAERPEKWEREPNPIELPGSLPPIYPRNFRLVRMSLLWGFGFLVFPLIRENFALVEEVISPPLVFTALAMLVSHLVQLRREFFAEQQYEEMSAHMVLEIPGRLLFFAAIYVALVTVVGGGTLLSLLFVVQEATGILIPEFGLGIPFAAAMVIGKLMVEWSRFQAEHEQSPTGFAT